MCNYCYSDQPSVLDLAKKLNVCISDPRRKYHVKILALSQAGDGYQTDQTVSTPGCVCKYISHLGYFKFLAN